MDILSYLAIGLLATSYPTVFLTKNKINPTIEAYLIRPLEYKLRNPLNQEVSTLLGELGMALNTELCLYPSYMTMLRQGFDSFFDTNDLQGS